MGNTPIFAKIGHVNDFLNGGRNIIFYCEISFFIAIICLIGTIG